MMDAPGGLGGLQALLQQRQAADTKRQALAAALAQQQGPARAAPTVGGGHPVMATATPDGAAAGLRGSSAGLLGLAKLLRDRPAGRMIESAEFGRGAAPSPGFWASLGFTGGMKAPEALPPVALPLDGIAKG